MIRVISGSSGRLTFRTVIAGTTCLVTYPFRKARSPTIILDVVYGVIRCLAFRSTIPQLRYLSPSTTQLYIAHCKRRKLEPKTVVVEGDEGRVAAHWIGDSRSKKVVLHFHGGGFTQAANDAVLEYTFRLVEDLNQEGGGRSVAVLLLAYSLAPEATHPTQLREAVAMLSHLIKIGRAPSDMFISGDSAGGNLALGLLSHLLNPHADITAVQLQEPLGGVMLYSPWVSFRTDYSSYNNESLDMMSPPALRRWAAMLLNKANPANAEADPGQIQGDPWTEACLNPASWWNSLPQVVSDIFVSYGSYEVFADPIRHLEVKLKQGWTNGQGAEDRVIFLQAAKEAHIAPITDVIVFGKSNKSKAQIAIESWYKARLSR